MIKFLWIAFSILLAMSSLQGEVIARLVKFEGRVFFKRLGMESFSERAKEGTAIRNGDQIEVKDNSFAAIIYIDDRSIVKVRENTKFTFMDTRNSRTIEIAHGTLLNEIKKEKRKKDFRIQTPVSVASVKGTQFAALVSQNGTDQFICKEGLFEVLNMISGQTVQVAEGQKAISNSLGSIMQAPATIGEYPDDPEVEDTIDKILEKERKIEELKVKEKPRSNNPPKKLTEPDKENIKKVNEGTDTNNENVEVEKVNDSNSSDGVDLENQQSQSKIQEAPNVPKSPKKPYSLGLGIGSSTIDGTVYNQFALRPKINIGPVGIGFDLVVYVDNEGNIRDEEWDLENDPSMILDKILFIRFGEKSDPGWVKYGTMESITLGYGGLMNGYSNMMEFPSVRRVGLNTGFNFGPIGGELFLSNLKDLTRGGTIAGMRAYFKVSDNIPLTIGVNYIRDENMFSGLKDIDGDSYPDIFDDFPEDSTLWNDTDGDGWPDPGHGDGVPDSLIDIDADGDNILDANEDIFSINLKAKPFSLKDNIAKTTAMAFDIGYPILNSGIFSLKIYSEFNIINFPGFITSDSSFIRPERSGTGITIPGLRSTIFKYLDIALEYRIMSGSYVPQYFDQAYDLNRVVTTTTADNKTIIKTKDMVVFDAYNDSASSSGLFGSAGVSVLNLLNFNASYSNMKSDTTELKSFSTYLSLNTEKIPKISTAVAYYKRNNDENPFDFSNPTENTIIGYRLGYELSEGVNLIWDFRQFYRDDGKGGLEEIQQTNIETTFDF